MLYILIIVLFSITILLLLIGLFVPRRLLPSSFDRIALSIMLFTGAVLYSFGMILLISAHGLNLMGQRVSLSNLILIVLAQLLYWAILCYWIAYGEVLSLLGKGLGCTLA